MQNIFKLIGMTAILMASCSSAHADARYAAKAFADVCLSAAPSFKSVPAKAVKYGGTEFLSLGGLNIATITAKDISIQYEVGKECTITTSKDASAEGALLKQVQSKLKVKSIPARVEIDHATFLIGHDRKGGEAFVIIRQ